MCNTKIKLYEMVELTVPAGAGNRVNFNTIPQLRNQLNQAIFIMDIQVFLVTVYGASQLTPAVPGMPAAELPKAVLVLYVNGEEGIKQIPLGQLVHVNDQANPFQEQIEGFDNLQNVDWDKSYVQFNAAPAGTPYVIPFGVKYVRVNQKS